MQGGDISNSIQPYLAFDIELAFGVEDSTTIRKRVRWLQRFHMDARAMAYYRIVPGAFSTLEALHKFYNIMLVNVAPKHSWKAMREQTEHLPYNTLCCVSNYRDLLKEFAKFRILSYQTLAMERRVLFPSFSEDFRGWDALKISDGNQPIT